MIVLDASVLIAAMHPQDEYGRRARQLLRAHPERGALVVHAVNLAEALVRAVEAGHEDSARRIVDLLGLSISHDDAEAPWRWARLRAGTRLRMPDCCALDTARRHDAPLATFDERLATLARAEGVQVA